MKKLLFVSFIFSSLISNAQLGKELFFDFGVGTRLKGSVSTNSTLKPGLHLEGGIGYMINKIWGIKADVGYDSYKAIMTNTLGVEAQDRSYMIRGSVQGILSISELAKFRGDDFSWHC